MQQTFCGLSDYIPETTFAPMKKLFFAASLIAVFGCGTENTSCIDQTKINKDAVCSEDYNPVCGCDKKTYSNVCKAEAAGVTRWDKGPCAGDKK
jgi:hypothetical protein